MAWTVPIGAMRNGVAIGVTAGYRRILHAFADYVASGVGPTVVLKG